MERADICISKFKFVKSRTHARSIILENRAFYKGKLISKPSMLVESEYVTVEFNETDCYVGRGAVKLNHAIKEFGIDLENSVCMDIGASTGGFTQIMLNNGARKIFAIDVGIGQLDEKLLNNSRVVNLENTNFRNLKYDTIGEKVDFISIDVSFISLIHIFENIEKFLKDKTIIVALIKPQYECDRNNLNKSGIVKSAKVISEVREKVKIYAENNGLSIISIIDSPILGGDGNKEFLSLIKKK